MDGGMGSIHICLVLLATAFCFGAAADHTAAAAPRPASLAEGDGSAGATASAPLAATHSARSTGAAAGRQQWSPAAVAQADAIYSAEVQQPGVHAMEVFGIGPQRQAGGGWQPDGSLPGAAVRSQDTTLAAAPTDSAPADLASLPVTSFSAEPARDASASGQAGAIGARYPAQDRGKDAGGDAPAAYAAALAAARQAPYKGNTGFGLEQKPDQARPLGDWEARLQAAATARATSPPAGPQAQTLQGQSASAAQPPAASKRSALGDRRLLAAAEGDAGAPAANQVKGESRAAAASDGDGAGQAEQASTVRVTIRAHTRQGGLSNSRARAPAGYPALPPATVRVPTSGLRGARADMAAPGSLERTGAAEALRAESPDMGLALLEQERRRAAQRRLAADQPLQRVAVSGPRMSAGSRRLRATARLTRRHAVPFPAARALQAFTLGQPLGAATGPTPPGGAGGASSALPEARAEDQSLNRIVSSSVEAGAAAAAVQGAGARLPGLPAAAPRVSEGAGADTRTASSEGGAAPDRRMSPLASAVLSLMQGKRRTIVIRATPGAGKAAAPWGMWRGACIPGVWWGVAAAALAVLGATSLALVLQRACLLRRQRCRDSRWQQQCVALLQQPCA